VKILLLTHSFNSLCQRVFLELRAVGCDVSIEFDIDDSVLEEAVAMFAPDLIIAPFLKRAIPRSVWEKNVCIIIHPGILGDKGPSSLDWAILNGENTWGVTALQANAEMDGGDIWAFEEFPMRAASKGSIYRNEITTTAVSLVRSIVENFSRVDFVPKPLSEFGEVRGKKRSLVKQSDRRICWHTDSVDDVLKKVRSGDGVPGVFDTFFGKEVYLFGAHAESRIVGAPGEFLARRDGAICVGCADGSVWISHMQEKRADLVQNREAPGRGIKLSAYRVLGDAVLGLPEIPAPLLLDKYTWQEIYYEVVDGIAYLYFEFVNGAMGTNESAKLLRAFQSVKALRPRAIVLMGGRDFWSNGINLNQIEMAPSAPEESFKNICAINKVAREILCTTDVLTVSALRGNAGSGGCYLALAADFVFAREGVVLNPHYKNMGNLYGSEYWTYVLPKRMGPNGKKLVMETRLPITSTEARVLGFVDDVLSSDHAQFQKELHNKLLTITADDVLPEFLLNKDVVRTSHEAVKSLDAYEFEELSHMRRNFFGFDPSYHVARYNFVFKIPHSRTPLYLARHRTGKLRAEGERV
jgi:putative two-component system hydrogenase maturation factor HypX/HoxX